MPGQKISTLTDAGALQAADRIPLARSGTTYSILGSQFASQQELDAVTNTITTPFASKAQIANYLPLSGGTLSVTSTNPTLTITQGGDGLVLKVNDQSGTDASPFAIDKDGHVLVGTPTAKSGYAIDSALTNPSNFLCTLSAQGTDSGLYIKSANGIPLYVEDDNNDTNPFIIDKNGRVGIGTKTPNPSTMLTVKGDISATGSMYVNGGGGSVVTTSSFTGSNQNVSGTGYQVFPGGLIIQWGQTGGSPATKSFPKTFPNACLTIVAGNRDSQGSYVDNAFAYIVSSSQYYIATKASTPANVVTTFSTSWIAIGH